MLLCYLFLQTAHTRAYSASECTFILFSKKLCSKGKLLQQTRVDRFILEEFMRKEISNQKNE